MPVEKTLESPQDLPAGSEQDPFLDATTGPFFRRIDWYAFWTAFLATLALYVFTLAPTVTLEDSGELAVASDYLGVPHPPGYPIWTLLTWLFQWVFHFVTYYGKPNPAWSVGLLSAVAGALACGVLALLVCRSGADILRSMKRTTEVLGLATENMLCWVGGVTAGLLLALSQGLWSQSVIVEVYSLNALFEMVILLLTYRWMCRPKEDHILYITGFVFGLGLTNHQTLMFVTPGLLAAIWFRDRALFRDCIAGLAVIAAGYMFWQAHNLGKLEINPEILRERNLKVTMGVLFLLVPVGLFLIERKIMTEWKRVVLLALSAGLGLSFYAYMPFSSEQNPPMNWGYPRTPEGFKHALSRGQYERVKLSNIFGNPKLFMAQIGTYWDDLRGQYTLPIAVVGLIPLFFIARTDRRSRTWLLTTLWFFVSLSVVLIIFLNPKLDIQTLFIQRVQLIQSHAVYAVWLGYGLIFGLAYAETLLGGKGAAKFAGATVVLLLPLVLLWKNAYNERQITIVGGSEQHGHDFGWQFGNYQLRGATAILEELKEGETPPPNPNYPPAMETNAVFFGGTDPGRFVPTYMIYSADVRSDVYLITQNALADNTYMNVMRDLYGDRIWIPSQQDSNYAFQKYVEDVRAGRIQAGADLSFQGGRVSVQGVQGVMTINGILARMIFEANKAKHAFYVEESYVIPWMYPYLTPHGLIMKINAERVNKLPTELVEDDIAFWDWYTARLMGNKKFLRDVVARKTFSKLRSAIAGLYAYRRMYTQAEHTFLQALDLYPLSPEANFRLADIYMQQRKFTQSRELIERFLEKDPDNDKVASFLTQIQGTEQNDNRRRELETVMKSGGDLNAALELVQVYQRLNLPDRFDGLAKQILGNDLPPNTYLQLGKLFAEAKRNDLQEMAYQRYLEREPANPRIWVDLAAVQSVAQKTNQAIASLKKAVEIGGQPVREVARQDKRFDAVRNTPGFKALVPSISTQSPIALPGF